MNAQQVRRSVAEAIDNAMDAFVSENRSGASYIGDFDDMRRAILAFCASIEEPSEAMVRAGDEQLGDSTGAIWRAMLAQLKRELEEQK